LEVFTIQNGDFMMDFHGISLSTNGHFMGFDRGSMRLQLLFFVYTWRIASRIASAARFLGL
jgi:hypothetical protein